MKSETCFGEMLEQYLPWYFNESDAQHAAEYSNKNHNADLAAYQFNKYDLGYLTPQARISQSKKCDSCTGGDGTPKNTYNTRNEAYTNADIIYEERRVDLKVYKCRCGDGWHLTKRR